MQTSVYNSKGGQERTLEIPEEVFNLDWNPDLVHQVVVAMQANRRPTVAHTKDRSEVSGGGKKPWRQKGTGRARHGSIRSPLWVGGGTTFGPRADKDYTKKINQKMKTKALFAVLSKKHEDGEVLFGEELNLEGPSTSTARNFLKGLEGSIEAQLLSKKGSSICVFVDGADKNVVKSFENIANVKVEEVRNINPLLLLENKYVLFLNPERAIETLKERYNTLKGEKAFVK